MKYLLLSYLLTSCCCIHVYTDHDLEYDVDVKQYPTYNWYMNTNPTEENNPLFFNQLNDKRIRDAVNNRMLEKGFVLTPHEPSLLLHYHVMLSSNGKRTPDHGTLIIDVMNGGNDHLLVRGYAIIKLPREVSGEQMKEVIGNSVDKIFAEFLEKSYAEVQKENSFILR